MKITKLKCPKCEHEFVPRIKDPIKCPKCGTRFAKHKPKIIMV